MAFRKGAYCKLWKIEHKSQSWAKVQLSTSKKDKDTGEYETDFSGYVDFFGSACVQKLKRHSDGDRVILGDVEVTTSYDKTKGVQYTNFKCFSFDEIEDGEKPVSKPVDDVDPEPEDPEDYPF